MDSSGVGFVGSGPTDNRPKRNDRRLVGVIPSGIQSLIQGLNIFNVGAILAQPVHALDVPTIGLVALKNVLAECDIGIAFDRDAVVVP